MSEHISSGSGGSGGGRVLQGGRQRSGYQRRAVLAGAAAAGAGVAAGLAGRAGVASAASAANGKPVLLGRANNETATTSVSNAKGTALSAATSSDGNSALAGADTSARGGTGITGTSKHGTGIAGTSHGDGQSGVAGTDDSTGAIGGYGVAGTSTNGHGIHGTSTNGTGVRATSTNGPGVYAFSESSVGVYGGTTGNDENAVFGYDLSAGGGYGVYANSMKGTALFAAGDATVTGTLSKGGGSFKIDHPLDPAGQYLYHSFVESPDMKNVYDGTVRLDAAGRAVVRLPDWFEALNRDYRYQLTAIGGPAADLHVAAEVAGGQFVIAGGAAGQQVCWQVTGIRQDAWANAYRIPVDEAKPAQDQGRYLHPELYGGEPITSIARAERHRGATTPGGERAGSAQSCAAIGVDDGAGYAAGSV